MGADSPTVTVYDPLGPTQTANNIVLLLGPGTHTIEVRVSDRHGATSTSTSTAFVEDPPLPSPPPPPPPPTPEFWGRRKLLAGVDAEPGDATYYTTSQPAYTLGYNATTAARYYDALLRPVIELGAHSQIVQAADAYARVFAIEPAGVLTRDGSCRTEDPEALAVAATHAKVSVRVAKRA